MLSSSFCAFLLGVLFPRTGEKDALIGFAAEILVMAYLFVNTSVAWTWFTFFGTCTTLIAGTLSSFVSSLSQSRSSERS